jgi:PIN domain nuclease of toxin-antitoxin system
MKPKAYVLDSWAVLAFYEEETAGKIVADLLVAAHEQNTPLWMSVVNLAEAWYIIARRTDGAQADRVIAELHNLGIRMEIADWQLSRQAASFKAANNMSLADAYAAALAKRKDAHLVTGDDEFRALRAKIKLHWLR